MDENKFSFGNILKTLHLNGIVSAVIEFTHDAERDVLTAVVKGAEATEHYCQVRLEGDLAVVQSHNMADGGLAASASGVVLTGDTGSTDGQAQTTGQAAASGNTDEAATQAQDTNAVNAAANAAA